MKKLFATLAFLMGFTSFSQSIIEINYSLYNDTIQDKYEVVVDWSIKIDLQYDKIHVWEEGFEQGKLILVILETKGPLYQSAHDSDDLYKYYQF